MIHLQITTGRGPAECCLVLHHVVRRMLAEGPGARLIRSTPYSSVVTLEGEGAADYARLWIGTVLWICEDPISPNRGRKNWYVGIQAVELPEPADITIREQDLKWEYKRARGNGGQKVNKTDSAARLTHTPTGVTVLAEDERSQSQNKKIAMERLRLALKDRHLVQMAMLDKQNWSRHNQLERGNPVRTFVGHEFLER